MLKEKKVVSSLNQRMKLYCLGPVYTQVSASTLGQLCNDPVLIENNAVSPD